MLHEQGYLPFGQLGSGGELLACGEAAAAVWPAPPDRIAAVQFGTLSLGPAHQQPTSHLDVFALAAASRSMLPVAPPPCSPRRRPAQWLSGRARVVSHDPPHIFERQFD